MGCASSRNDMTPVESTLHNGEQTLIYQGHLLADVFKIHIEYSENGYVTPDKLMKIAKILKLGLYFEEAEGKIRPFYDNFKVGENYCLKKLLVVAMLIIPGSGSEKSKLLFDLYDSDRKRKLEKTCISEIIDTLFDISLERLPTLILEADPNKVTSEHLSRFFEITRLGKEQSKNEIIEGVSGGKVEVDKTDFSNYFGKEGNDLWLDSRGLRKKLRKLGKKIRKQERKKTGGEETHSGNVAEVGGIQKANGKKAKPAEHTATGEGHDHAEHAENHKGLEEHHEEHGEKPEEHAGNHEDHAGDHEEHAGKHEELAGGHEEHAGEHKEHAGENPEGHGDPHTEEHNEEHHKEHDSHDKHDVPEHVEPHGHKEADD